MEVVLDTIMLVWVNKAQKRKWDRSPEKQKQNECEYLAACTSVLFWTFGSKVHRLLL